MLGWVGAAGGGVGIDRVGGGVGCFSAHNKTQPILTFAIKIADFKLYFIGSEGLLLVVLIT